MVVRYTFGRSEKLQYDPGSVTVCIKSKTPRWLLPLVVIAFHYVGSLKQGLIDVPQ